MLRLALRIVVVCVVTTAVFVSSGALLAKSGQPRSDALSIAALPASLALFARAATSTLDWLVVSPAGDFDHGGARTGRYRTAAADAASRVSYADFAVALLDEIDTPKRHRAHLGVEAG